MSTLIALSLMLSGLLSGAPSKPDPLPFLTDFDAARSLSGYEKRPIYLHLSAEWCEPCKTLREEIYTAPAIQDRLRRFIRVDLDAESERGKRVWMDYKISALPSALVIRPDGASLDRFRVTGVLEVDALSKLLDEALLATDAPRAAKRDRDPKTPEPEGRPAQERWGNYLWFIGCGLLTASLWMKFKQRYPKAPGP